MYSSLDFYFSLSLLPSLFAFLASVFFLLLSIKQASFWWEKFLGKLRILGLDERKGGCVVVEQNFHGNFQVNVTWFLAFFSTVLD